MPVTKNCEIDPIIKAYIKNDIDCEFELFNLSPILNDITECTNPHIKDVIYNGPATIVFWSDNTKTVVKACNEPMDKEKGLAMAIAKKALGNKGNYYNEFKKWLEEDE